MTTETAILAGGCFWCTEAVFKDVEGVLSVESGYIGGHVDNPTYEQVCSGRTGHAEAVKVSFDPAVISRDEILDIFFATHDPTQKDRQGNDVGPQYRSAIFFADAAGKAAAERAIARAQAHWDAPIVTRLEPAGRWWPAEAYHQDYFARVGTSNPYCAVVVAPKLAKFRKSFAHRLKSARAAA
jgi:peptide-methionine (S)-S-oxide reductase